MAISDADREYMVRGASVMGLVLEQKHILAFCRFAEMLEEANAQMNLTRIPIEQWAALHFLDSLALAPEILSHAVRSVADVGTGAGFPGIPLAIVCPDTKFTLLDGTGKKVNFVKKTAEVLGLTNVIAVHGRAEDISRRGMQFDMAAARAVSPLNKLASLLLPLVRTGGTAAAFKSGGTDDEIKNAAEAVRIAGGKLARVQEFTLPETEVARRLIFMEKEPELKNSRPKNLVTGSRPRRKQ